MPRAIWKGKVIAEAPPDKVHIVEGNVYFPRDALHTQHFTQSGTHTTCSWKGVASYLNVVVDGEVNPDAAWYYPSPEPAAQKIAGYVAFWHGVAIEK
jgi:uncharacterized protein (DUF427 family)